MDIVIKDTAEYVAPALDELGTVVEVTLGSASFNSADDTQYFQ
ncbi:lasso RiPP family leader peptide-containing protein [Kitasatospora sp. NPDC098663]